MAFERERERERERGKRERERERESPDVYFKFKHNLTYIFSLYKMTFQMCWKS